MSKTLIFYYDAMSPCARSVMLLAKSIGLEMEMRFVDLTKGEHLKPEYIKMNPTHAVPWIDDNGFILWESHAILPYIATVYAKDDKLYPKDPKKRAKVDQWLHYDNGILYNRARDMSEPLWVGTSKVVSEEKAKRAEAAIKFLDEMLDGKSWLCGDEITIADITAVCTVTCIEVFIGDVRHYPNVCAWMDRCKKTLPGFTEINDENNKLYGERIRRLMTT